VASGRSPDALSAFSSVLSSGVSRSSSGSSTASRTARARSAEDPTSARRNAEGSAGLTSSRNDIARPSARAGRSQRRAPGRGRAG
jgi:hypothetical protein